MRLAPLIPIAAAACHAPPPPPPIASHGAPVVATLPPPPPGFAWRDHHGDRALAAPVDDAISEPTCEVWDVVRVARLAITTGADVSAGGAEPTCARLSPRGTLVEWGNGRNTVWKDLRDRTTACRGEVAPDDASCVEVDVSPFMLDGADQRGDDLELRWSRPTPDGPTRVVAVIPDGLDRDGPGERWWTVRYCSAATAIIDIRGGTRVVIDATTGDARTIQVAPGAPPCP